MLRINLRDFLDEKGAIAPKHISNFKFVEFIGLLVAASTSKLKRFNPSCFSCGSHITSVITYKKRMIVWQCNRCENEGIISHWHGTLWDMSNNHAFILKSGSASV